MMVFSGSKYSKSYYQKVNRSPLGVESYGQLLVRLTKSSLGVKSLNPEQIKALDTYHQVVRGEEGTDGAFARVGNYTLPQRRKIINFLREVFTSEQVTTLIEDGVVEINRSSDVKITRRVLTRFNEGKKVFIQIHRNVYRLSRVSEKMESGFLVEAEFVSLEGYTYTRNFFAEFVSLEGYTYRRNFFLVTSSDIKNSIIEINPTSMTKISEKNKEWFCN